MAMEAQKSPVRKSPLKPMGGQGVIERSFASGEDMQRLRLNPVYQWADNLAIINSFAANTTCYIDLPIGKFTYRQWALSLVATANIAGVTTPRDGREIVNSAFITNYIDTIWIEIDGKSEWEMTAAELLRWNDYQNLATTDGVLRFPFGAPGQHTEDNAEDAYQLGTANLSQLRLKIRTKAAWPAGMVPVLATEYAEARRPLTYFMGTTRYTYTNPAIGKFAISDLPVGRDWAFVWVQGASINRIKIEVDRDILIDTSNYNLRALHESFGKDVAALGAGFVYDSFRDGDGIGLDSVTDSARERKRGADVRMEMEMGAANVTMSIIVGWCGLLDR